MNKMSKQKEIKDKILALSKEYSELVHKDNLSSRDTNKREWEVGMNIPYAGRVFDSNEVPSAISSTLDFWLTLGNEGKMMEYELASFMGVHKTLLVNSGSSANLVALSILTSHILPKEKRLLPGDEVITVAAGFPTTVAPIIQNKAIPVFLDINPKTGNLNIENLENFEIVGSVKKTKIFKIFWPPDQCQVRENPGPGKKQEFQDFQDFQDGCFSRKGPPFVFQTGGGLSLIHI